MRWTTDTVIIIALVMVILILIVALLVTISSSNKYRDARYMSDATPVYVQQQQRGVYVEAPAQDHIGNDIVYRPDLAGDVQSLRGLCDITPGCVGFNSGGYLKNSISPLVPSSNDFYYHQQY
jgi:hypothetical protein